MPDGASNQSVSHVLRHRRDVHGRLTRRFAHSVPEGQQGRRLRERLLLGQREGIWRLPYGIYSTAVGYCAGFTPNPTYNEACSGMTGHTEGVRVVYDPEQISLADILRWFWEAHDPTSGMGQGNDRAHAVPLWFYYFDDDQKRLIEASTQFTRKN